MKKKLFFIFMYLQFTSILLSQVGIGTNTPDSSALLHLSSTDKGVLFTKVNLSNSTDRVTVPNPANGLVVYNTGASFGVEGLYFNLGTPESPNWNAVQGQSSDGTVIEYNNIKLQEGIFDFRSLTINPTNWTEIESLRQSFTASSGTKINVIVSGMVEVWHEGASQGASFQADYLVRITPITLLPGNLVRSSNPRSGFVISTVIGSGVPERFGSNAINYSEQIIASSTTTYHVQVFVARVGTSSSASASGSWLARNWSTDVFVSK